MLVYLQTLLAVVAGDELDLRIREAFSGQMGQHLMTEEVRMHVLGNACSVSVVLHDLLDAPCRVPRGRAKWDLTSATYSTLS